MLCQHFFLHHRSCAGVVMDQSYDVLHAFDLIPINRRSSSQHPQAPSRRKLLVQRSHQRKKLLDESRRSACRLPHFPPHFLDFRERDILSRDITIQDRLVQRIAALEFNVVHLLRKSRRPDQREDEIIQILQPMALRHGHDFVFIKSGKNGGYSGFWNRIGAPRLRLVGLGTAY